MKLQRAGLNLASMLIAQKAVKTLEKETTIGRLIEGVGDRSVMDGKSCGFGRKRAHPLVLEAIMMISAKV